MKIADTILAAYIIGDDREQEIGQVEFSNPTGLIDQNACSAR